MSYFDELMKNKDVKKAIEKAKKEGIKFSKKASAAGKNFGKQALAYGTNLKDAGKLKLEIMDLEMKVEKAKLAIGKLVVEQGLPINKDDPKIKAELEKVGKYVASIAKKNATIKKLIK